jgi:hypothetical protein
MVDAPVPLIRLDEIHGLIMRWKIGPRSVDFSLPDAADRVDR